MPYRPPLADHPRAAVVVSLLSPLIIFGWVVPLVSGVPPRWPWVISESLMIAVITYVARTRSNRFLGGLVAAVSLAALVLYAVMTYAHGFPQAPAERTSWVLAIALPVFGLVLGAWMLRQPSSRRSS